VVRLVSASPQRAEIQLEKTRPERAQAEESPGVVARSRAELSQYLDRPYSTIQLLLVAGGLLVGFGLLMAGSTTISASLHDTDGAMWTGLIKHLEFLILGLPLLWLGLALPPRAYRIIAYPALVLALISLLAVLVPGVGVQINGARRWIDVGPLQLQPSEFAKLALLLWGADLLTRKRRMGTLTRARHVLVPIVPGFLVACALIMVEPDLGTTMCFLLILLSLLWTVGLPLRYFALMLLSIGGGVTLLAISAPYRLARLTSFADPFSDAQGSGYHAVQGLYALSSGGLFGVGLGQGTSKYGWVPNASTDYVFSVIGEELGLLGCIVVLGLFGLLAFAALRLARRTADPFVTLAASACAVWITGQALINIGYVTALLPVTGIPLPFISAGGTSLMLMCGVLGMLLSFARHEPAAVAASQAAAAAGRRPLAERLLRLTVPRAYVEPPVRIGEAARSPRARAAARAREAALEIARERAAAHKRETARARRAAARPAPKPAAAPNPRSAARGAAAKQSQSTRSAPSARSAPSTRSAPSGRPTQPTPPAPRRRRSA
jgi:cell division protein FtsW